MLVVSSDMWGEGRGGDGVWRMCDDYEDEELPPHVWYEGCGVVSGAL